MLIVGFIWVYQTQNFLGRALEAKGVIIGELEIPEGQQPRREPPSAPLVIKFVDERTGEEYRLVTKTGLDPRSYAYNPDAQWPFGQEVDILYDPDNPHDARINSFLDIWLGPIAVTVFGGILSSVGLILIVRSRKHLSEKPF